MPRFHVVGFEVIGLLKVRDHCLFRWRERPTDSDERSVEITDEHCDECVAELRDFPRAMRFDDRRTHRLRVSR